ncbi:MAG: hypothetical protein U0169_06085 [Polyangiaceae bacterium]
MRSFVVPALPFLASLALASGAAFLACSNSNSAATGDGGATSSDAGDAGDGEASAPPGSRGTGAVTVTSDLALTNMPIYSASALFLPPVGDAGDAPSSNGCTTTTVEGCVLEACPPRAKDPKAVSAGAIAISGGTIAAEGITLTPDDKGLYATAGDRKTLWNGGEDITVRGAGAEKGVPAFESVVKSPVRIVLTEPAITRGKNITISRNEDLVISWGAFSATVVEGSTAFDGGAVVTPAALDGEVEVVLVSQTDTGVATLTCAYPINTGGTHVPRGAIGRLSESTGLIRLSSRQSKTVGAGTYDVVTKLLSVGILISDGAAAQGGVAFE